MEDNFVIVLIGPTATGKTKLAIDLAKEINGEIVSADSMQVYKYMNIGTAKPTEEEMEGIPHYLIDEIEPDQEFSVAKYKSLACNYIDLILGRGKVPILVGGTGLYINSVIYNVDFAQTITDWELREKLKREAEEKGNEYIYSKLKQLDPESAENIHANDVKRIIRALEVISYTKKTISHYKQISRLVPSRYKFILVGLTMEREKLYSKIDQRVDLMVQKGLINEVIYLANLGYSKSVIAMQGIGYKEILTYLNGEVSLEEAIGTIKMNSRRYAKRQLTWFRKIKEICWFDVGIFENNHTMLLENIKLYIASKTYFL